MTRQYIKLIVMKIFSKKCQQKDKHLRNELQNFQLILQIYIIVNQNYFSFQPKRLSKSTAPPPTEIKYSVFEKFQLRCHIYQARGLIGSDASGLSGTCLFIYLFVYLVIYFCTYLFIYLFVCLFVCLFYYLFIYDNHDDDSDGIILMMFQEDLFFVPFLMH